MWAVLSNPTFWYVAAGCGWLGLVCGVLGCLTLLRRQSLLGDTLAHAALPGVGLAFVAATALLNAGWAINPRAPEVILIGALASALLGALWTLGITATGRVKPDTAQGIVLSVFFGAGVVVLSAVQHSGLPGQAGLDKVLFGSAASIVPADLEPLAILGTVVLLTVAALYKEFKVLAFDPHFAAAAGWPVRRLDVALTALTAVAVVIGLQSVGVVLTAAMLIAPPAAARQWTQSLGRMMILAGVIGAVSGVVGAFVSSLATRVPTGPVIVLVATAALLASLGLAPGRGLLGHWYRLRAYRRRVARENLLADMFRLDEAQRPTREGFSVPQIAAVRQATLEGLVRPLSELRHNGLAELALTEPATIDHWRLTDQGRVEAARVVRNHRLWELFLSRRLDIAPDHVHRDAEDMEHTLPPELVAELTADLDRPDSDPHGRSIPPLTCPPQAPGASS